MKILKSVGYVEILTRESELRAQLLQIENIGRTCYQSKTKLITWESAEKFVRMILKRGHESVIEHSCLTVRFNNVSRGFTHEQVRHRLTAISQESTRYVDYAKEGEGPDLDRFELKCVVPPHRDENETCLMGGGRKETTLARAFLWAELTYRALRKAGWPPEDARQILPIGTKSQIVISANFREWRHIFKMRTAKDAHWEIRKIMCDLLDKVRTIIPVIVEDFIEAGSDKHGLRYFEQKQKGQ